MWGVQIERLLMEISVENSEGSNTKSLDLKTLYKSEVSNTGGPVKKGTSSWLGNGEGADTKKRKNRKEVAISNFEDLTERKKIKHIIDDTGFDEADTFSAQSSGLGQKLNSDSGFNGIGIDISGDGVLIPKRPRGSVGRSKFAKSNLLELPADSGSVEIVAGLNDELKEVVQNEVSGRDPLDCNDSSTEQIVNLNGESENKSRTKQKEVVGCKSNENQEATAVTSARDANSDNGDLVKLIDSLGSEDEVAKLRDEIKEILPNKVPGAADATISGSLLGSEDEVSKFKNEIKEIPQNKDVSVSSNSTSADQIYMLKGNSKGKLRNNVKKEGIDGLDGNEKQKEDSAVDGSSHAKEEGSDLVLINKDSPSKRNSNGSNRRKSRMLGSSSETVAKKVVSSAEKKVGTLDLDPDDDLEQNAARMLSSRFDPSCTGFASKNRTLALSSANGESLLEKPTADACNEGLIIPSDPASTEAADRVLRPRRHQKGKGNSRKRRHFYEIHSDDMDAHWFLNRKIKIFWPLDESWYYGLVNDYDAEKNLHHIKYDDRDEEWISLENERFKLLLLPNEVPRKPNSKDTPSEDFHKEDSNGDNGNPPMYIKDEAFMATHMESEPIISWLALSSQRVKPSASLKKQKKSHPSDSSLDVYNRVVLERETDKPNYSAVISKTSVDRRKNEQKKINGSEGHLPIVYVRRRYRRFSDATDATIIESKKCEIFVSLWPMIKYLLGADILWLLRSVFLLKYGTVVPRWPNVFLEVLFVDNIVGLRLFLFEGCLKQAVAFIFLVMEVFCEPEKDESINLQIPVTTIRFKLSFFENFRKQKVFAYYSFSKLRDFNWQYLDLQFQPHCSFSKKLSLSECTYDNIKLLEEGIQHSRILYSGQTASYEVSRKKSNPGVLSLLCNSRSSNPVSGSRPSTIYSSKHGNLPPFAVSFTAAPNFFLSLHLKLLLERSISLDDHVDDYNHIEDQFEISSESSSKSLEVISSGVVCTESHHSEDAAMVTVDRVPRKSANLVSDAQFKDAAGSSKLKDISVEIPTSDEVCQDFQRSPGAQQVSDLTWNMSDGIICSPNPTGPRSLWHGNKSLPFGDPLNSWGDGKMDFIGNGFGNGPKKPRTQVQYTLPSREFSLKNKSGHNQTGLPYQRIRKANDKKTTSDASKGPRRNLELVACDANILINGGDKGWREIGARVFLEASSDQNEWKLAVKCSGDLKYAYKVHQDLQPGSTNRYTHAMMWKGGKDWALEFPDRSQWFLFKEMHEECHNRNIRAASIKNIPIPGVRLIEDLVVNQEVTPFTRSSWYLRQVRDDVEMAMDSSNTMYDMDSEDEEWVCRSRASSGIEEDMISDELFEKIMDMFEKVSYAQKRDHFTSSEIDELITRVSPMQVAKSIYTHWREKRQRKGMPLIRQLQPPLWEKYQQICKEWEQSKPKITTGPVSGSQEKTSACDKPPMFAFCLKPRGLELLNKGSKHRPHKKISLSGHSLAFLGDHDTHHSSGRRVNNTHGFGDERTESSDMSPLLSKMYSPRDSASGPAHFSLDGDASEWNHQMRIQRSNNSKSSIRAVVSPKVVGMGTLRKSGGGKRNNEAKRLNNAFGFVGDWHHNQHAAGYRHSNQLVLGGSDLDEFRLRDASSAAKHARNMAKLKRERAQKLMLSADLAIHKAVSALMTAEAIRAASCTGDGDGDDDRIMKSSTSPSTTTT